MSPRPLSLAELTERHRGEIVGYLARLLGDRQEAEDACQEAFLRAHRAFDRLGPDASSRAWLYRIATNTGLNAARRRSHRAAKAVDVDPDALPAAAGPSLERREPTCTRRSRSCARRSDEVYDDQARRRADRLPARRSAALAGARALARDARGPARAPRLPPDARRAPAAVRGRRRRAAAYHLLLRHPDPDRPRVRGGERGGAGARLVPAERGVLRGRAAAAARPRRGPLAGAYRRHRPPAARLLRRGATALRRAPRPPPHHTLPAPRADGRRARARRPGGVLRRDSAPHRPAAREPRGRPGARAEPDPHRHPLPSRDRGRRADRGLRGRPRHQAKAPPPGGGARRGGGLTGAGAAPRLRVLHAAPCARRRSPRFSSSRQCPLGWHACCLQGVTDAWSTPQWQGT